MGGYLILIGGNEDKIGKKEILKTTLYISETKKICIITTASQDSYRSYHTIYNTFKDINPDVNIEWIDIRKKSEIETEEHKLENTDLIYITGGDQVRLAEMFNGTEFIENIKTKFNNGEFNIAGTSAGSAIMGEITIYDEDRHMDAFNFVPKVVIDTHFNNRHRYNRLERYLINNKIKIGIGLDEDTAVIYKNNKYEVIGSGSVTVINNQTTIYNNGDRFKLKFV